MARVKLVSQGMRELLNAPGVTRDLERRGRSILAAATATAPVDTGAYRDGLTMWTAHTDRTVVRIGSSARHSPLVEAMTGNLARALDAAGGA